jgi:type IV secretory pathway TrbD component
MKGTPAIYFKSLNRHFNVLGVDRQLFYLIVGVSLPIAFSGRLMVLADIVALSVFIVLHTVGVLITKADNQMLAIYRRHIHFKKYYAANPGIHATVPVIKPSVPIYEGQRGLL